MKYSVLLLIFIFSVTCLQSQERWSTSKPVTGNYSKLPSEANGWQNTNKEIRFYQILNDAISIGPSVRVLPNSNQQDEIVLVRNPLNANIMFGSANTTVGSNFGQGSYVTTNGGVTWTGTDVLPSFTFLTSDPGPCIDKNGTIIMTTLNVNSTARMYSTYSTNNGTTWSTALLMSSASADKNFAASDDAPSSSFYGRSYAVWSNFAAGSPPIVIAHTTDGAQSWSAVRQINTPLSGHYSQGCDILTGPNGEVYVSWAAPTSTGNFTEDYAGFAKSTNGGINWVVTENAYDMNGIRATSFNSWGVRVNGFTRIGVDRSGGARNGWIYIVASEYNLSPAGSDADVILHRSSNGGSTWSAGIRVNQDALNNGKVQFFPAIRVDEQGGVNVVYYDNRNYPSLGDSCHTYMSRSTDGGTTWTDMRVSDHAWKVKGEAGSGNYMGDYIGVTSGNNKVWPFWFDDKTGTMQAWTCAVSLDPVGIDPVNNTVPSAFELKQNFPNPFNPSTFISFSIPENADVSLEVFDAAGKKTASLLNEYKSAGSYKMQFNASELSSGIYFYKLTAGSLVSTKKMILVK
ncbi:MAG: T9SS type A sorting domain-containing protein [Ignavibacteria bacterium]|nr:T9SS type A sorting domain-containing protein [Ignavibacteria bacterium]